MKQTLLGSSSHLEIDSKQGALAQRDPHTVPLEGSAGRIGGVRSPSSCGTSEGASAALLPPLSLDHASTHCSHNGSCSRDTALSGDSLL